ncbi:hypothetical protein PQR57_35485 [Paraburkholderia dipogonis]|uniref:Uncharacterized protein n=1 Tax=Paraburkholderia dipogonis TaxID=1211383 RepID=A0ABW9B097_9BURK
MPDDSTFTLLLAFADFFRIWSSLEVILENRAVRVQILDKLMSFCDLPCIELGDTGTTIGFLLPDGDSLQARTRERCGRRLRAGLPMYSPAAAFANSGWNAVPDRRRPFTMRFLESGLRNTYWHLEV